MNKKNLVIVVSIVLFGIAVLLFFSLDGAGPRSYDRPMESIGTMKLSSITFEDQQPIPPQFTCDGSDVNPELRISDVPGNAQSLVLIMDDPDATGGKTWDHWVVWNIDPKTTVIKENTVPAGATQGTTSFGANKYGGPCPPRGARPHRYMFKLYALDIVLELPATSTKQDVESAMGTHVLDQTILTGLFNH